MKKTYLTLILTIFCSAPALHATVADEIRSDSRQTAQWISRETADMMAFSAASQPLLPGAVLDILGVQAGVSAGLASFELDVARYRALPLSALDNRGGEVNLPDRVPVPSALAHAKVGLLGGFDLGVKAGALNFKDETGDAETEYDSVVYGAELRKKLLGGGLTGAALPDVALSLSYDAASGEATRKERYNGALRSGGTLAADTVWKTEWNVSALTARAVASKTLLMITPYAGVGYTTHMGDAETSVSTRGTASPGGAVDETATASADADDAYVQALAGVELGILPLLRLNAGCLWSPDAWTAAVGLRLQFR
jgi:hypothetical protein